MPRGSILFTVFMNVGLYALFTTICFILARPPHDLVKAAMASRLASWSLPAPLRRLVIPRQMSKEQAVAVCFCGAAKTSGVGIPLVAAMWAGQDELRRAQLAIPVLLYTMEQVFLAQGLVYVFKWYLGRNVHSDLDVESAEQGARGRGRGGGGGGVRDVDGVMESDEKEVVKDSESEPPLLGMEPRVSRV